MMEYVIKVIDPETKEVDWYKEGSVIFEVTDIENGERKPTIFRGGIASRLDKAQRLIV